MVRTSSVPPKQLRSAYRFVHTVTRRDTAYACDSFNLPPELGCSIFCHSFGEFNDAPDLAALAHFFQSLGLPPLRDALVSP